MTTTTPSYASGFTEGGTHMTKVTIEPFTLGSYLPRPRARPMYHPLTTRPEVLAPQPERVIADYAAPAKATEIVPRKLPSRLEAMANIGSQPF